eukprot:scaffold12300_cov132-Isochrysis_galbana.AAC.6
MSISSYASDPSAASIPHSCEFLQSTLSRQSGMVQPVVNEMFATVHAAGSSHLGLFTSCTTFDSTNLKPNIAPSVTRPSLDSAGTRRPVWSVPSTEAPVVRSPSDTVIDEEFSSSQSKVFKSQESAELPPRDNLLFTAASQVLGHGTGVGQFSVHPDILPTPMALTTLPPLSAPGCGMS